MATKAGIIREAPIRGGKVSFITLSGTVKVNNTGVVRRVIIIRNSNFESFIETLSDSDGEWTVSVRGGSNDKYLAICLGSSSENSEVYDQVQE